MSNLSVKVREMSSTGLLEEKSNNLEAEQMNYADDNEPMSVLRRLEKKFQDIMLAVQQVWEPRMVQMEGRITKLELAVDKLLASMSNNEHSTHNSRQRCLNLQFTNKISSPIRTGEEIKGVGGNYVEVVLVDETGKVVDFGPEASAEVKIVAFKGDCDDNEGDATKIGYFTYDNGRDRKAKKSIRAGDVLLKLNKGIGILANVKFRNSSRHGSGVFKLGAKVIDCFDGTVVKDAKTESFTVKDYRGKYNEKHHPPSLSDDICHLDNIGRGVSKRLRGRGINTLEDFLIQLLEDTEELKEVMFSTDSSKGVGLPPKKWEVTLKHALTCQPDEKVYYSIDSEENNGVVFNVVGEVLGLIQERKYVPLNKLSDKAKTDASKLEIAKIVQKQGLLPSDNEASLLLQFSQPTTPLHPTNDSMLDKLSDHEDEISKVGESCQTNLINSFEDGASSSNFTGGTSENFFDFGDDFFAWMDGLREADQHHDQQDLNLESLWYYSDDYRTANINNMSVESRVVSDYEVKKKLFFLFTVSKWILKLERMAACDGNDNQKRPRIGTA